MLAELELSAGNRLEAAKLLARRAALVGDLLAAARRSSRGAELARVRHAREDSSRTR